MPKKTVDYSRAVVYRLIHNFITYYVGSTTNFRIRKSHHKSTSKNENMKCNMLMWWKVYTHT